MAPATASIVVDETRPSEASSWRERASCYGRRRLFFSANQGPDYPDCGCSLISRSIFEEAGKLRDRGIQGFVCRGDSSVKLRGLDAQGAGDGLERLGSGPALAAFQVADVAIA